VRMSGGTLTPSAPVEASSWFLSPRPSMMKRLLAKAPAAVALPHGAGGERHGLLQRAHRQMAQVVTRDVLRGGRRQRVQNRVRRGPRPSRPRAAPPGIAARSRAASFSPRAPGRCRGWTWRNRSASRPPGAIRYTPRAPDRRRRSRSGRRAARPPAPGATQRRQRGLVADVARDRAGGLRPKRRRGNRQEQADGAKPLHGTWRSQRSDGAPPPTDAATTRAPDGARAGSRSVRDPGEGSPRPRCRRDARERAPPDDGDQGRTAHLDVARVARASEVVIHGSRAAGGTDPVYPGIERQRVVDRARAVGRQRGGVRRAPGTTVSAVESPARPRRMISIGIVIVSAKVPAVR